MTDFISRLIAPQIAEAYAYFPVLVLTGPRQSGKTCLAKHMYPTYRYVNLEDITTRAMAATDPSGFLDSLGGEVIIDEVQNVPELLSMIQVRVDEDRSRRYIITGSSNFSLLQSVTQSLAGRCALFTLLPFSMPEVAGRIREQTNWQVTQAGMYPGVVAEGIPSRLFYQNYYNTYVERDLRNILNVRNIVAFDRFMRLLASRVGSEVNASALARETGVSAVTISEWMSILAVSYIAFPLRPYFSNLSKRLTKMPKYYFYDTGLLCFLLGIASEEQLQASPLKGAIYENMAVCELIKRRYNEGLNADLYYYRERGSREVDALEETPDGLRLYEVKAGETFKPDYAANMKSVAETLGNVATTTVIYNGPTIPPLAVNLRDI